MERSSPPVAASAREVSEANALRKALRIHAYGSDIPVPVQSAEQMVARFSMSSWLRTNVLEAGYHELTLVKQGEHYGRRPE